jgi:hypothetical protein
MHKKGVAVDGLEGVHHDAAVFFVPANAFHLRPEFFSLSRAPAWEVLAEEGVFDVLESMLALSLFRGGASPVMWRNMHRPLSRSLQITIASRGFMSPSTHNAHEWKHGLSLSLYLFLYIYLYISLSLSLSLFSVLSFFLPPPPSLSLFLSLPFSVPRARENVSTKTQASS